MQPTQIILNEKGQALEPVMLWMPMWHHFHCFLTKHKLQMFPNPERNEVMAELMHFKYQWHPDKLWIFFVK